MSPEAKIRNDLQDLARYILGMDLEIDPKSKERLINISLGYIQRIFSLPDYTRSQHHRTHLTQFCHAVSAYCMFKETKGMLSSKGYLANARTYLTQAQRIMEI